MSKFLSFNNVLCVAPHPDDIEIAMLGTILKHKETNFYQYCISSGGDFDSTTSKKRQNEVKKIEKKIKNLQCIFENLGYIKNLDEDLIVKKIEDECFNLNIECILTTSKNDIHFEHRKIFFCCEATTRNTSISLIEYQTVSSDKSWQFNYVEHIEKQYKKKIKLLKHFKSQKNKKYFEKHFFDVFHSDPYIAKKTKNKVEKFNINMLDFGEGK